MYLSTFDILRILKWRCRAIYRSYFWQVTFCEKGLRGGDTCQFDSFAPHVQRVLFTRKQGHEHDAANAHRVHIQSEIISLGVMFIHSLWPYMSKVTGWQFPIIHHFSLVIHWNIFKQMLERRLTGLTGFAPSDENSFFYFASIFGS